LNRGLYMVTPAHIRSCRTLRRLERRISFSESLFAHAANSAGTGRALGRAGHPFNTPRGRFAARSRALLHEIPPANSTCRPAKQINLWDNTPGRKVWSFNSGQPGSTFGEMRIWRGYIRALQPGAARRRTVRRELQTVFRRRWFARNAPPALVADGKKLQDRRLTVPTILIWCLRWHDIAFGVRQYTLPLSSTHMSRRTKSADVSAHSKIASRMRRGKGARGFVAGSLAMTEIQTFSAEIIMRADAGGRELFPVFIFGMDDLGLCSVSIRFAPGRKIFS